MMISGTGRYCRLQLLNLLVNNRGHGSSHMLICRACSLKPSVCNTLLMCVLCDAKITSNCLLL